MSNSRFQTKFSTVLFSAAVGATCTIAAVNTTWAQAPAAPASPANGEPTAEQVEQAKKLFAEAKAQFEKKEFAAATDKFKESYRLSKKPLLLYYVGLGYEEQGQKELAVMHFRKFLADAPPEIEQRKDAQDRVKALEAALFSATAGNTSTATTATKTEPAAGGPKKIKPAGTYTTADVQHVLIEDAPPGKPLDITAAIPDDSGWTVTLFYRPAGDEKFVSKPMRKRYNELVARIPVDQMTATSVHYYLEVKDQAGQLIDRRGKPSSPNIIFLDASVQPRYYPDWQDIPATATGAAASANTSDDDDPLGNKPSTTAPAGNPEGDPLAKGGFFEVGSKKFNMTKWGATGVTAALLTTSVVFYVRARNANRTLEEEAAASTSATCPTGAPCTAYDSFLADAQSTGQSGETISRVTLGIGVATAAFAGYFWYRELTAPKRAKTEKSAWLVAPTVTPQFAGAAAQWTF